jgi:hypothetical protein
VFEGNAVSRAYTEKHVRWHVSLVITASLALGLVFGRTLLSLGVKSLLVRNAIVFPATYLLLFGCVLVWRRAQGSDAKRIGLRSPKAPARKKWRWLDDLGVGADSLEATLILVAIIALIGTVVWCFGEAPAIVEEAIFDVGLSASLVGALRKREDSAWHVGLFRKTIVAFLVFYFSSALLLFVVHRDCPNRPTLAKVIRTCWMRS